VKVLLRWLVERGAVSLSGQNATFLVVRIFVRAPRAVRGYFAAGRALFTCSRKFFELLVRRSRDLVRETPAGR